MHNNCNRWATPSHFDDVYYSPYWKKRIWFVILLCRLGFIFLLLTKDCLMSFSYVKSYIMGVHHSPLYCSEHLLLEVDYILIILIECLINFRFLIIILIVAKLCIFECFWLINFHICLFKKLWNIQIFLLFLLFCCYYQLFLFFLFRKYFIINLEFTFAGDSSVIF